jgi:translation initiation factor IF-3
VRLISQDGQQLGIVPVPDALRMAQESDLDLVEVAPLANPPVCRIMDYRKWQYEEKQRAKESRRKASNVSVKEMKYRPKIGVGDFDTKTRKVAEFLSEGHKVKVTIMFRGREVFHPELGAKILDHIAEDVAEVGKVETQGRLDGRNMTMVLAPDKKKVATRRTDERSGPADDGRAGDGVAGDGVLATAADRPAPSTPEPAPAAVTTETPSA